MTHSEILRHYYLIANPFSNKYTVRPGYFLITNEFIESDDNKILVKAHYHPFEAAFLHESVFTINLKSLFTYNAVSSSKGIPPEHLINAIIKIDSIELVDGVYNDQPTKSYKVTWQLINFIEGDTLFSNQSSLNIPNESLNESNENNSISGIDQESLNETVKEDVQDLLIEFTHDSEEENELLQLLHDLSIDPSENELSQLFYDEYIHNLIPTMDSELDQLLYDQLLDEEIKNENLNNSCSASQNENSLSN